MAFSFDPSSNPSIRPAIAHDKWQIQQLLSNFERETPRSKKLDYFVMGLLLALGINLTLLLGLNFLLGIMSLVGIAGLFFFLSIFYSQEWQKFWIIEQDGRIVACGKLCHYATYSVLYNVLVEPGYRRQGLGSALVQRLGQEATKPLYLACFPDKVGFYTRLGFVQLRSLDLSPMLRYELGLTSRPDSIPLVLR
jgi:GNAT superfamily N-acetyltransferase